MNENTLKLTTAKVLEDWALMLIEEADGATSIFTVDEPLYRSSMQFEGVIHGKISIIAQKPFLEALTRNLLAIDQSEPISTNDAYDSFREMANVVLGNFLTEAYGADTAFALKNPNVSEGSVTETLADLSGKPVYAFIADGVPVALSFEVTE